ncbi:hypothetical protein TorRG33x02_000490 [Trema orientale]|uniref:RNase H type-1 domain-containing protein n=1 Tax=Trema orientale TaxID=63057 RepID=A0A2P5G137_TREOI|nr:hypothetical protein TorRG33x02_000490 [Trema orientale]
MTATLIRKYQDSSVSYDEFLESYRLFGCFGLLGNGGQVYGVFVCRAKSRFSCGGIFKTASNLSKKGVKCGTVCFRCKSMEESVMHALSHGNHFWNPSEVLEDVGHWLFELQQAHQGDSYEEKVGHSKDEHWQPPELGLLKLNVDAVVNFKEKVVGVGGFLALGRCNDLAEESLNLDDVRRLMSEVGNISYGFISRKGNNAAYTLAKFALSLCSPLYWLEESPDS